MFSIGFVLYFESQMTNFMTLLPVKQHAMFMSMQGIFIFRHIHKKDPWKSYLKMFNFEKKFLYVGNEFLKLIVFLNQLEIF